MYEFRDGSGYSDPSLCPMLNACQQSIGNRKLTKMDVSTIN